MVHANVISLRSDALDDVGLRALARSHGGRIVVDKYPNTPYKCLGGSIINLQRAGFRIVSVRVNGVELPRQWRSANGRNGWKAAIRAHSILQRISRGSG